MDNKKNNSFNSYLESSLKKRIESGNSTKSDRLNYAKIRYTSLSKSSVPSRINPFSRLRDKSLMSNKRMNRIVAGKGHSHRDKLLDSHAESLANRIKEKAELKRQESANKNNK